MRSTILAIEAAVGGGSVAILKDSHVLANWHSEDNISRSEELLFRFSELLDRAKIGKADLTFIAVSNGPGSYTGIRIGLSTAMGLARSLGIPCRGISVLKAVAVASKPESSQTVLLPIGRNGFCWQTFSEAGKAEAVRSGSSDEFLSDGLLGAEGMQVLAHHDAYASLAKLDQHPPLDDSVFDLGRDLAIYVGMAARFDDEGLTPFYAADTPIRTPSGEQV